MLTVGEVDSMPYIFFICLTLSFACLDLRPDSCARLDGGSFGVWVGAGGVDIRDIVCHQKKYRQHIFSNFPAYRKQK